MIDSEQFLAILGQLEFQSFADTGRERLLESSLRCSDTLDLSETAGPRVPTGALVEGVGREYDKSVGYKQTSPDGAAALTAV
jgi:hypothetical protein